MKPPEGSCQSSRERSDAHEEPAAPRRQQRDPWGLTHRHRNAAWQAGRPPAGTHTPLSSVLTRSKMPRIDVWKRVLLRRNHPSRSNAMTRSSAAPHAPLPPPTASAPPTPIQTARVPPRFLPSIGCRSRQSRHSSHSQCAVHDSFLSDWLLGQSVRFKTLPLDTGLAPGRKLERCEKTAFYIETVP